MRNDTIKAVMADPRENARQPDNKELIDAYSLVTVRDGRPIETVTVRWYASRRGDGMGNIICNVWIHGQGVHASGRGLAGGCGYCKRSAAFADALLNAGVELYGSVFVHGDEKPDYKKRADIGGTGMQSVEQAMRAVTRALGFRGQTLVIRH